MSNHLAHAAQPSACPFPAIFVDSIWYLYSAETTCTVSLPWYIRQVSLWGFLFGYPAGLWRTPAVSWLRLFTYVTRIWVANRFGWAYQRSFMHERAFAISSLAETALPVKKCPLCWLITRSCVRRHSYVSIRPKILCRRVVIQLHESDSYFDKKAACCISPLSLCNSTWLPVLLTHSLLQMLQNCTNRSCCTVLWMHQLPTR